jgi:hypothetical protein
MAVAQVLYRIVAIEIMRFASRQKAIAEIMAYIHSLN